MRSRYRFRMAIILVLSLGLSVCGTNANAKDGNPQANPHKNAIRPFQGTIPEADRIAQAHQRDKVA